MADRWRVHVDDAYNITLTRYHPKPGERFPVGDIYASKVEALDEHLSGLLATRRVVSRAIRLTKAKLKRAAGDQPL